MFAPPPPPVAASIPSGATEPDAAPPALPAPATPVATAKAAACERSDYPLRLFVQIYDEASRESATAVVRALQDALGDALRVAPIEDVTRSAALRSQRRPVPWPQPTLIVHDPAERACAGELAALVRAALPPVSGRDAGVWVRDLPRTLTPSRGVIELWIPPYEGAAAAK